MLVVLLIGGRCLLPSIMSTGGCFRERDGGCRERERGSVGVRSGGEVEKITSGMKESRPLVLLYFCIYQYQLGLCPVHVWGVKEKYFSIN
ncbi:hypothetical protein Hanom_Chr05g00473441 [Helianthus anomalus]